MFFFYPLGNASFYPPWSPKVGTADVRRTLIVSMVQQKNVPLGNLVCKVTSICSVQQKKLQMDVFLQHLPGGVVFKKS